MKKNFLSVLFLLITVAALTIGSIAYGQQANKRRSPPKKQNEAEGQGTIKRPLPIKAKKKLSLKQKEGMTLAFCRGQSPLLKQWQL